MTTNISLPDPALMDSGFRLSALGRPVYLIYIGTRTAAFRHFFAVLYCLNRHQHSFMMARPGKRHTVKIGTRLYMRVYEVLNAETSGNFLLRERQYTASCGAELARKIVHNKILNQRSLLMSIRNKTNEERAAIARISTYLQQAPQATDRQVLLGLEGKSAQEYFRAYFSNMAWNGRKPRIKHDIPNLLLDIGYTYLFNLMECLLRLYGFDVYKGVYHTLFFQRKSLVCDLVEPFRCIIDQALKRAYGLKQVNEKDFEKQRHRYILPFKHNKKYTRIFLEALMKHKTDMFLYVQSWYRNFMRQNPIDHYPVFDIGNTSQKR